MSLDREALLRLPALAPPPGVQANFVNPYTTVGASNARNIAIVAISTPLVWTRIFTKCRVVRRMDIEDYLITLAWVILVAGMMTPAFLAVHHTKLGAHQWDLTVAELIEQLHLFHIITASYCAGTLVLKSAIGIQCLRTFAPNTGRQDATFYLSHLLLWGNIVLYLVLTFLEIFSCWPMEAIWDVTVHGRCMHHMLVHMLASIFNTVSDFLLVVIPQKAIWTLHMRTSAKVGISACFVVGIGACMCSALRIPRTVELFYSSDVTYHMELTGGLAFLEFFFGLCAACVPVLPKFAIFLSTKTPFASFSSYMQRMLGYSQVTPVSGPASPNQAQIGTHNARGANISDAEFHDLVDSIRTGTCNSVDMGDPSFAPMSNYKPPPEWRTRPIGTPESDRIAEASKSG
ncbi:hypothetical protein K491DRAFT_440630 [Lophiostoma macrostomum CBS 122681]|uniref:Rhodopsin domain-containing protein n=1 Tax=Lophiostoma macrostomum CBS 122681 TaxID=1314788 RepID=A0A6A6T512_9PLEO|nr:hypothetical protein K491DRAFT_440630 [Lophiostoma macrostomum CBS 122681]